jgi:hypothetical protein
MPETLLLADHTIIRHASYLIGESNQKEPIMALRAKFLELLNADHSIILNEVFIYNTGYDYDDIESLEKNDIVYEIRNVLGDHGEFSMIINKQDLDTLKLNEEGSSWTVDATDGHGEEAEFSIEFMETKLISVQPF